MSVDGVSASGTLEKKPTAEKTQSTPPPPPQQQSASSSVDKNRQQELEDYEAEYLKRLDQQRLEYEQTSKQEEATTAGESATDTRKRGALPKGFEPQPKTEPAKKTRGTLPKGF